MRHGASPVLEEIGPPSILAGTAARGRGRDEGGRGRQLGGGEGPQEGRRGASARES